MLTSQIFIWSLSRTSKLVCQVSICSQAFGFIQFYADYSLFSYHRNGVIPHVLVYVDDLIIAGNNSSSIVDFKNYLGSCFHMKDLGILKYFLGIEIARDLMVYFFLNGNML